MTAAVPAVLAAGLVGASRIQQDKHYLSDVIVGFYFTVLLTLWLHRVLIVRRGESVVIFEPKGP